LQDGPRLTRGALGLLPPKHRPVAEFVWSRLDPVLKSYFIGVIVVVIYAVAAAYVGLGVLLGIGHALFLAVLAGLLGMVPRDRAGERGGAGRPGRASSGGKLRGHHRLRDLRNRPAALDRPVAGSASARTRRATAPGHHHLSLPIRRPAVRIAGLIMAVPV